jgi:glycosyltransferase involved in cell wall biosynthesis
MHDENDSILDLQLPKQARVVFLPHNCGPTFMRIKAARMAKEDFMVQLDGDDTLHRDYNAIMYPMAGNKEMPYCLMSYRWGAEPLDLERDYMPYTLPDTDSEFRKKVMDNLKGRFMEGWFITSAMIPSLILRKLPFDPMMKVNEDAGVLFTALRDLTYVPVREVLWHHRVRHDSYGRTVNDMDYKGLPPDDLIRLRRLVAKHWFGRIDLGERY